MEEAASNKGAETSLEPEQPEPELGEATPQNETPEPPAEEDALLAQENPKQVEAAANPNAQRVSKQFFGYTSTTCQQSKSYCSMLWTISGCLRNEAKTTILVRSFFKSLVKLSEFFSNTPQQQETEFSVRKNLYTQPNVRNVLRNQRTFQQCRSSRQKQSTITQHFCRQESRRRSEKKLSHRIW